MEEKMEEKKFTIEEAFCAVPKLKDYFLRHNEALINYDKYKWDEGSSYEAQFQRVNILLSVFQDLRIDDLMIAYYLRELRGLSPHRVWCILEKYYDTELKTLSDLSGESLKNPMYTGWIAD